MYRHYGDILALTDRKPLWWDEHGVPRFQEFDPEKHTDVYASEAALVLVECQSCGEQFKMLFSDEESPKGIRDRIKEDKELRASDPPNSGCCEAGPSMTCWQIRVLQFWAFKEQGFGWKRYPKFEVKLTYAQYSRGKKGSK